MDKQEQNTDQQEDSRPEKRGNIVSRVLKLTGYLLLFIVAMQLGQLWMQRDVVIGKAPLIQGEDINGQAVSLHDYRGKPLLLYFWATWCPICRFEHSVISSVSEDYQVLSIAMQSGTANDVKLHMREHDADYRVINDPDGILASSYGIRGVPTSFIIDADGDIRTTLTGYTTGLSLRYRLWSHLPETQ